jgi:esterase/lipase superfamily enzyme
LDLLILLHLLGHLKDLLRRLHHQHQHYLWHLLDHPMGLWHLLILLRQLFLRRLRLLILWLP